MKLLLILYTCLFSVAAGSCPERNRTAAALVNRPCRKWCAPGKGKCRDGKRCLCDQECGLSCINPKNHCDAPPQIEHQASVMVKRKTWSGSLVLPSGLPYNYNDWVEYVCQPGFERIGPVRSWCHGRKSWTKHPQCVVACLPFDTYLVKRLRARCGLPCVKDDDCKGSKTCACNGICGRTCVDPDVDCGTAPPVRNADVKYNGDGFGRVARYRCREGYFMTSGSSMRTCMGGGRWSGSTPRCEAVVCGDPMPSMEQMKGTITNYRRGPFFPGHLFFFSCPSSYRIFGSRNRTCLTSGRWSGADTVCDLIDNAKRCPHPGIPINGHLLTRSDFTVGSSVEFSCQPGFTMIGQRQQVCLYFLQWSGDGAPQCTNLLHSPSTLNTMASIRQTVKDLERKIPQAALLGRSGSIVADDSEIYFLIDMSASEHDVPLRKSLDFASKFIQEMSSPNVQINVGVAVYGNRVEVITDIRNGAVLAKSVVDNLEYIWSDRHNLRQLTGRGRDTSAGLRQLQEQIRHASDKAKSANRKKFIFVMISGAHTSGNQPSFVVDAISFSLPKNKPTFYGVLSCIDCSAAALEEALSVGSDPQQFIFLQDDTSIDEILKAVAVEDFDRTRPVKCGQAGDVQGLRTQIGRIVGGIKAREGSWPWQAVITINNRNMTVVESYQEMLGGGSLISEHWILTAAHLFVSFKAKDILITLGMHEVLTGRSDQLPDYVKVFGAARIISHPKFNASTFDYDVALVRVDLEYLQIGQQFRFKSDGGAVTFSSHIKPVCLPCSPKSCVQQLLESQISDYRHMSEQEKCDVEGKWLIEEETMLAAITGFGHTDPVGTGSLRPTSPSEHMKQGLIAVLEKRKCIAAREHMLELPPSVRVTDRMLCGIGGKADNITDACQGDSGGPMVTEVLNRDPFEKCWVQVGIVSWGWGCGQTYQVGSTTRRFPGYYANVWSVISWIKSNTDSAQQSAEQCTANSTKLEPGRTCRKLCINDLDCPGQLNKCLCDDVCGKTCFNPHAPCAAIRPISNGHVGGKQSFGGVVTYRCNSGYFLRGNRNRKCRSDKQWTGTTPICVRSASANSALSCPKRNQPQHTRQTPYKRKWLVNDIVTYSCIYGYVMSGNASSTCTAKGEWSAPLPACTVISCADRSAPAHSRKVPNLRLWHIDDAVTYECDTGYIITGNATSVCTETGQWSNDLPKCQVLSCTNRNQPPHSRQTPGKSLWLVNDKVTYNCIHGYIMSGFATSTCTVKGKWSSPLPTCTVISCANRSAPPHSRKVPDQSLWHMDDAVTYECDTGYIITGNATSVCTETGQWSNDLPKCQVLSCTNRNQPPHSRQTPGKSLWLVNDKVTYNCIHGYVMSGFATSTCTVKGKWSSPLPTCSVRSCPKRNQPQHSRQNPHKTKWLVNDTVTYNCIYGYVMSGNASSTCTTKGIWSSRPPRCAVISCPHRIPALHVRQTPQRTKWFVGNTVAYTCNRGFILRGRPISICNLNGRWSTSIPTCSARYCPSRNRPPHSRQVPDKALWFVGDRVTYTCSRGYDLSGSQSSTCMANFRWSSKPPRCKMISCPNRLTPAHSRQTPDQSLWNVDDAVTYECNVGYVITGTSTSVCTETGLWSNDLPTCQVKPCQPHRDPVNGKVTYDASNLVASFSCNFNYRIEGESKLRCLPTGSWSSPPPTCQGIPCPPRKRPPFSKQSPSKKSWKTGDVIIYSCLEGYALRGSAMVFCFPGGRWSTEPPTCEAISCRNRDHPGSLLLSPSKRSWVVGDVVTYSCEIGYVTNGPKSSVCRSNGEWSSDMPSCVATRCPHRPTPTHAIAEPNQTTWASGSKVNYMCNSGFVLIGRSIITCLPSGRWSSSLPKCASSWRNWSAWSRCTLPCATSRQSRQRSCDGFQTGSFYCQGPAVQHRSCKSRDCPFGVPSTTGRSTVSPITTASIKAPNLFDRFYPFLPNPLQYQTTTSPTHMATASSTNSTSNATQIFELHAVTSPSTTTQLTTVPEMTTGLRLDGCAEVYPPSNSAMIPPNGPFPMGSVVRFKCKAGFRLLGNAALSCQPNKKWSSPVPICQERGCRILRVDLSLNIKFIPGKEYRPGSQLTAKCKKVTQVFLGSTPIITCMGKNVWKPDHTKLRCVTRL